MGIRKPSKRESGRRHPLKGLLPLWTTTHANLNTSLFVAAMAKLGINGVSSYLRRLVLPILICSLFGAYAGALHSGVQGLIVGALSGIAAPAAVIWLVITLTHMAIYLTVICLAWVVLFYVARWILRNAL